VEALPHVIKNNLTALKREMVPNILVPVHAAAVLDSCLDKDLLATEGQECKNDDVLVI